MPAAGEDARGGSDDIGVSEERKGMGGVIAGLWDSKSGCSGDEYMGMLFLRLRPLVLFAFPGLVLPPVPARLPSSFL